MNRREFLGLSGITSGFLLLNGVKGLCSVNKPEDEKPNILLIVVDDQGYADLSCSGLARDVHTPNMEAVIFMLKRHPYSIIVICRYVESKNYPPHMLSR